MSSHVNDLCIECNYTDDTLFYMIEHMKVTSNFKTIKRLVIHLEDRIKLSVYSYEFMCIQWVELILSEVPVTALTSFRLIPLTLIYGLLDELKRIDSICPLKVENMNEYIHLASFSGNLHIVKYLTYKFIGHRVD